MTLVNRKAKNIEPYDLFDLDIHEVYDKASSGEPTGEFDYDRMDNSDLWLIRVPEDFDERILNGKKIHFNDTEVNASFIDHGLTYQMKQIEQSFETDIEALLPVKTLDGAMALAPKPFKQRLALNLQIEHNIDLSKAKRLRDEPKPDVVQKENLKMHFYPVGFWSGEKVIKTDDKVKVKEENATVSTKKSKKNKEGKNESTTVKVENEEGKPTKIKEAGTKKKSKKAKKAEKSQ